MKRSSLWTLGVVLSVLACAGTQEKRLDNGAWHIRCGESMSRCTNRAEALCGDRGYHILGGGTRGDLLGGATGYRTRVESSELIVRCGAEPVGDEETAEGGREPVAAPEPAPAHNLLCVPGSTQACVGPGGCSGGQSCLADGSGYGACDCGGAQPAAPPAAAPTNETTPETASPPDAGYPAPAERGKEL